MKKKGLLLDRDGVINEDSGYVGRRDQFVFKPGLFSFLRAAQDIGYKLAILTNQSGVARGYFTEKDYENLTHWMLKELSHEGIVVQRTFVCFEHKDGKIPGLSRESYWRKPNPGMVLEALQQLNFDAMRSAFLGDKRTDMDAARAGHIAHCLWFTQDPEQGLGSIKQVRTFDEALKALEINIV